MNALNPLRAAEFEKEDAGVHCRAKDASSA